jgi:RNA recognition motif-containing protein
MNERDSMSTRIYVGNLSFHTTVDTLRQVFAEFGEVVDAHVATDRMTGQSRGFGFVTMGSEDQARQAIERMNGADLDGRALRVNEAEERRPRGEGGGGFGGRGGGGGGFGGRGGGGGGGFGGGGGGGGRGGRGGRGERGGGRGGRGERGERW